jgi:hypothetical protein
MPGPEEREIPAEDRLVLAWVAKASAPLVDLHDPRWPAAYWRCCGASVRRHSRTGDGAAHAGPRREEAVAVTLPDCTLPTTGRGRLVVHRARHATCGPRPPEIAWKCSGLRCRT